jgi:hypothetical protein
MLNNPDIQPNTTINHWIAGILLFNFKLVHVPSTTHGPDSLSRQPAQPDNPPEPEDDCEDWIDRAYRFMHIINPTTVNQGSHLVLSLFTLTNAEAPADSFHQPLTTNFIHRILAMLTDIVDTMPDFTPLIITDPAQEHIPRNDHQNKANLKLNLVVALLRDTYRPTGMIDQGFKRLIRFAQDFFLKGNVLWHKSIHGHHKVVIPPAWRLSLITQAHDYVGHHGVYPVQSHVIERFWWLHLQSDVKWFVDSCHVCQTRHYRKNNIPLTIAMPATLFGKVYIDTMFMPKAGGFGYMVHACCSVSSYPEARMLCSENHKTLADFIFQDILCRWGAIQTIVTETANHSLPRSIHSPNNMASITSTSPATTHKPTVLSNTNIGTFGKHFTRSPTVLNQNGTKASMPLSGLNALRQGKPWATLPTSLPTVSTPFYHSILMKQHTYFLHPTKSSPPKTSSYARPASCNASSPTSMTFTRKSIKLD